MTARISLALALHNHQPVGNFGWVFGEVYEVAYRPLLEALERQAEPPRNGERGHHVRRRDNGAEQERRRPGPA